MSGIRILISRGSGIAQAYAANDHIQKFIFLYFFVLVKFQLLICGEAFSHQQPRQQVFCFFTMMQVTMVLSPISVSFSLTLINLYLKVVRLILVTLEF